MIKLKILLIILGIISMNSCKSQPIGLWEDNIKLSIQKAKLKATADEITITTQGSWWWITDITIDELTFSDFAPVDTSSERFTIEQDCLTLTRKNANTLLIQLNANPSSKERIITIGLEAGNYFDRITLTQEGE